MPFSRRVDNQTAVPVQWSSNGYKKKWTMEPGNDVGEQQMRPLTEGSQSETTPFRMGPSDLLGQPDSWEGVCSVVAGALEQRGG